MSMITNLKKEDLIALEDEVKNRFLNKEILAPIHLSSNNEDELIKIFKEIPPNSWILSTWRSHYHALLHGIPKEKIMAEILKGHSISLNFPEHRFFASGIVAGTYSIGVGLAWSIKLKGGKEKVFIFAGEMGAETGAFHECYKYAKNHKLPVKFIIEDNSYSVCSDTRKVWGTGKLTYDGMNDEYIYHYKYTNKWPHSGPGQRIEF